MANVTTVMIDGIVKIKKNKKMMMMKDGQCVYMSGKMGMIKMDKSMQYKL